MNTTRFAHQHDLFCAIFGCHRGTGPAAVPSLPAVSPSSAPAAPIEGPSLPNLLMHLHTRAHLVYESSTDLCRKVEGPPPVQEGPPVKPAINLETQWSGQSPRKDGHRGSIEATPHELLHAMGETIRGTSILPGPLAQFSGHWAVVAYLSCIHVSGPPSSPYELRLSPYARALKGRQRGIWSEAMAVGVANLLVQSSVGPGESASQLLDVDHGWLQRAIDEKCVTHVRPSHRPDYLVARRTPGREIMVIECKGKTGARGSGIHALEDALEQATSIGPAKLPVRQWAVAAACSENRAGTWHPQVVEVDVVDNQPPPATPDEDIAAAVELLERLQNAQLLAAIGDVDLARRLFSRDERVVQEESSPPEDPQRDDQGRGYRGRTLRIAFGAHTLEVFLGIDEQIRQALSEDAVAEAGVLRRELWDQVRQRSDGAMNGYVSVRQPDGGVASLSAQGTLLSLRAS